MVCTIYECTNFNFYYSNKNNNYKQRDEAKYSGYCSQNYH